MVYQYGKVVAFDSKPSGASIAIEDYDTEDNWHVRKWSDGYVEMSITKFCPLTQDLIYNSGDLYYAANVFPHMPYPLPLVERYCEHASYQVHPKALYAGWVAPRGVVDQYDLTQTMAYSMYRATTFGSIPSGVQVGINITVNGRWKPRDGAESVSEGDSDKEVTVSTPEAVLAKGSSAMNATA